VLVRAFIIAIAAVSLEGFPLESAVEPAHQAGRSGQELEAGLCRFYFRCARAGDDYDLRALRQHRSQLQAIALAHSPLNPVALDRITYAPRHSDSEPRRARRTAGKAVKNKMPALPANAMALDPDELARMAQPIGFSEPVGDGRHDGLPPPL
jgi:hypothetical protein